MEAAAPQLQHNRSLASAVSGHVFPCGPQKKNTINFDATKI